MGQRQASPSGVQIVVLDMDGIFQDTQADTAQFEFSNVTRSALADGTTTGEG